MLVCAHCGNPAIQQKFWVEINTKIVHEVSNEEADQVWCDRCEDHVSTTDSNFIEE